jgi:hypothetical protein
LRLCRAALPFPDRQPLKPRADCQFPQRQQAGIDAAAADLVERQQVVSRPQGCDDWAMARKIAISSATDKPARTKSSRGYQVLGMLPDGVRILKPKSKPKHFTSRQIRSTIKKVLKSGAGG